MKNPPLVPSWQLLRTVPVLAHLNAERLRWLAEQVHWKSLKEGDPVSEPFKPLRVHVLLTGQVQVSCTQADGKTLVLGELQAGQMVGCGLVAPSAIPAGTQITATEPSLLAVLDGEVLQNWLLSDSTIMTGQLISISNILWQLATRVVEMGTLNVRSRLHMRLLALAQRQGVQHNQVTLTPSPTQASLAAYLGTSREEVAREMSRLQRLSLLQRQGRTIVLPNIDGLMALTEAQ